MAATACHASLRHLLRATGSVRSGRHTPLLFHARAAARRPSQLLVCASGLVDPSAKEKYMAVVPTLPKDPSKVKDLRLTEAHGPRGVLLVGFSREEGAAVRSWLAGIEPGFVVAHCPAAALADGSTATLQQALGLGPASEAQQAQQGGQAGAAARLPEQGWEAAPGWVPPVVFFSGMSGEEVVGLLEAWEQYTGLQQPAFASVTEATLGKPMLRLVKDIVRAQPTGVLPAPLAAAAGAEGGGAAGSAEGEAEEPGIQSRLKEFVMLGADGEAETEAMDIEALREQLKKKVEEKRRLAAAQAAGGAEGGKSKRERKPVDEEDPVLRALMESRKKAGGSGGKKGKGGKSGGGGFGAPKAKGFGG